MTEQHPITPPAELVQEWREQAPRFRDGGIAREYWLMTRAAQWGADQELEACLGEVSFLNSKALAGRVRAARRPKSPNLKERALARPPQAQAVLDAFDIVSDGYYDDGVWVPHIREQLAAALEAAADQMGSYQSKKFLYSIADYIKLQDIAAELRGNTEDN